MKTLTRFGLAGMLLMSFLVHAQDGQRALTAQDLEKHWAEINYQLPDARQEPAFAQLAAQARQAVETHSQSAALAGWYGIILSTWAGVKGGPEALDLVNQARDWLEKAISLDARVLDGTVHANLACLYYRVPGWPLAFGDRKKAAQLLDQALALSPEGIDENFYYGDFLYRQGNYAEAVKALDKALSAAPRVDHELSDTGRHKEAEALLAEVRADQEQP